MSVTNVGEAIELDWLLKIRLVVARRGEADCSGWWNTRGQLSRLGASALSRGFPRTHHFAQARSVFAAAANRCSEVFAQPRAITLWWLGEDVEEAFDLQWEHWLDHAADWKPFFEQLAQTTGAALEDTLAGFGLVDAAEVSRANALNLDSSGKSLRVSDAFDGGRSDVALLALGFARGAPGHPVVPYALGVP